MRSIFPADAETRLKLDFFGSANGHYFVEVGANQPRALSQTWELEQRGWTGVLLAPRRPPPSHCGPHPDLIASARRPT